MAKYFVAPDGADEPTLWEEVPGKDPAVVIRRAELPGRDAELLWRVLTGVLCADDETTSDRYWDGFTAALDAVEEGQRRPRPRQGATVTTYYKVLNPDGSACHGGRGSWHLPTDGQPGEWMPRIPDPEPCQRGYHLCRDTTDLLAWLGPVIWLAEADGLVVPDSDKVAVESARLVRRLPWDERSARLFAADCAERVLSVFEQKRPDDDRPRKAIETARRFAEGEATKDELAAAWDAARAAASGAARAAASGAAGAAAWDAARTAARAAAWTAAGPAARAAAWDAAWDAERAWQAQRLTHYLHPEEQP